MVAGSLVVVGDRVYEARPMAVRAFAGEVEAVAPKWRERVFTADEWTQVGEPGSRGGTFGCFPVSGVALGGFAKPRGAAIPTVQQHPVAALEKIASDLAFDLQLPVPPAQLWKREGAKSHGREVVVSAAPFKATMSWLQVIKGGPAAVAKFLPMLEDAASAISPFDTWLLNGDRANTGNLVVSFDVTVSPNVFRAAYIDFANSMARVHRLAPDIWKDEKVVVRPYPDNVPVNLQIMGDTISKIEAVPDAVISAIVSRIPPQFLIPKDRDDIEKALIYRRGRLRSMMRSVFPGVP